MIPTRPDTFTKKELEFLIEEIDSVTQLCASDVFEGQDCPLEMLESISMQMYSITNHLSYNVSVLKSFNPDIDWSGMVYVITRKLYGSSDRKKENILWISQNLLLKLSGELKNYIEKF